MNQSKEKQKISADSEGEIDINSDEDGPCSLMEAHKQLLHQKVQASKECFKPKPQTSQKHVLESASNQKRPEPKPKKAETSQRTPHCLKSSNHSFKLGQNAPQNPPVHPNHTQNSEENIRKRRDPNFYSFSQEPIRPKTRYDHCQMVLKEQDSNEGDSLIYRHNSILVRQKPQKENESSSSLLSLFKKRSPPKEEPKTAEQLLREAKRREKIKEFLIRGEYDRGRINDIREKILDRDSSFDSFIKRDQKKPKRQPLMLKMTNRKAAHDSKKFGRFLGEMNKKQLV